MRRAAAAQMCAQARPRGRRFDAAAGRAAGRALLFRFSRGATRAVVFFKVVMGGRAARPWCLALGCVPSNAQRPPPCRALGFEPRVEGLGLPPPRAQSAPQPDGHACSHAWTQCFTCLLLRFVDDLHRTDHEICVRPLRTGLVVCTLIHM